MQAKLRKDTDINLHLCSNITQAVF